MQRAYARVTIATVRQRNRTSTASHDVGSVADVSAREQQQRGSRILHWIEEWGNRLPHPGTLFGVLALLVVIISAICAEADLSVTLLRAHRGGFQSPKEVIVSAHNLLTKDSIRRFLTQFVQIYSEFPPLGITMVVLLGVGVLEHSGFISAFLRRFLMGAPRFLITGALALFGILSSVASIAGIILIPTIGAALYRSVGRHPWVGVAAGYAAAAGGFSANLFIAGTDVLLAGITQSAASTLRLDVAVHPLMNWYFMAAAALVVVVVVTLITERIVAPRFESAAAAPDAGHLEQHQITASERRGLRFAGIGALLFLTAMLWATVPEKALLRNTSGYLLPSSPLTQGIVAILVFLFFILGISYGVGARSIRSAKDIPKLMEEGLRGSLSFLAVALPASIFIYFFRESRLATILAVSGAEWLSHYRFDGLPLILSFMMLVGVLNLFMPSGSAKWMILAPVFVPMFAYLQLSPAMSQLVFRIGDSSTNVISPLKSYLPVLIGLLAQYRSADDKPVGIGSLLALELPYFLGLVSSFTGLTVLWYLLNLPLGPGASIFLQP